MYAEGTSVSVDRSKSELRKVIYKNEGSNYQFAESEDRAMVMFMKNNRIIRFDLHFPSPDDRQFILTPTGRDRTRETAFIEWEGECRRRWRALILCLKAKFETVDSGISSFEEEFMAHIVLPNNKTVAKVMLPQIDAAYNSGKMPKLLEMPE